MDWSKINSAFASLTCLTSFGRITADKEFGKYFVFASPKFFVSSENPRTSEILRDAENFEARIFEDKKLSLSADVNFNFDFFLYGAKF